MILLAAPAGGSCEPWPGGIVEAAMARGARVELALLHQGGIEAGCRRPLAEKRCRSPCIITSSTPADFGRVARLLTRRGVGLVLSGGGARGFAHLGIIRALREARVPHRFSSAASSIGAIIAAGVAMGWSDEEMQLRYRRSFVDTNPVNDYTFPFVALTRGRKVSRLLEREYGDVLIEDLRHAVLLRQRQSHHRPRARASLRVDWLRRCAPRSPFPASCRRCFTTTACWSMAPPSTTCRSMSCRATRRAS